MDVQNQFDGRKGSFFIEKDDEKKAEMTYVMAGPKKLIIDHTEVDEALQGQGVGRKLLDALISHVRTNEIKVLPLCPYAKSVFQKESSIRDVLA